MNGRSALMVLISLSGSLLALGVLARHAPDQSEPVSRLSVDDTKAMRAAATGAWRSNGSIDAEPAALAAATEVVTVSAAQFRNIAQKGTLPTDNRGSLAFDLQRELARVGCYGGEINGAWTATTRQAMKTFLDRVNATLPIGQPDPVHLALVQSQAARVCDTSCPPGQVAGDGHACTQLSSRQGRPANEPNSNSIGWSTTTTVAPSLPSFVSEGQMALAGPKPESDLNEQALIPVTPSGPRPRPIRENSRGDWRTELWKRQN
jgi:hypothetical protein